MTSRSMSNTMRRPSRRHTTLLCACAFLALASPGRSEESTVGTLTIRFSGIEEAGGVVIFSVAGSRAMFESEGAAQLIRKVPVGGVEARAVYEKLGPGEYAVKVFHDANENQQLDMGLMGPKEKFGFSNDAMGFMGPPDFDDAKFAFDGRDLTIEIEAR